MKIKEVIGERLIVRPVRTPLKYGHIHLPVTSVRNTQVGKVFKVGQECSAALQAASIVIFDHLAGMIIDKAENLLILREEDVLGILDAESLKEEE